MHQAMGFPAVASHAVSRAAHEPLRTAERSYSAAETPTPIGQETPVPPSPQ